MGSIQSSFQKESAYDKIKRESHDPELREDFWREHAKEVHWDKFPKTILKCLDSEREHPYHYRWFMDGELNMCYNCVDRHLEKHGDSTALIFDSQVEKGVNTKYTYKELHDNVSRLAGVFKDKFGVVKGDRVIIYMPMIAEAIFAMLASARLGAIHSVVFGGFSAKELSNRIKDAKPKLIVTASCGIEPHKVIPYYNFVSQAIKISGEKVQSLYVNRAKLTIKVNNTTEFDYEECMKAANHTDCVPVKGSDELYILYTSGTTGIPKGIVRDTGGTAVGLMWNMKFINGIKTGDTYFAGSDIGWVVGHSFIVYGPLLMGAATVLYEGKPHLPDPGQYWRIVQEYKVNGLYSSPTGLRCIRRYDPEGKYCKPYDTSTLHNISLAGERFDVSTFNWIKQMLPHVLINDNYWQTESGWIISCNYKHKDLTFPEIPGTCTKPGPGWDLQVLDDDNNVITEPRKLGKLSIKLPCAPSFMLGIWGSDERFIEKYLADSPGYYTTGDAGFIDEKGFFNVLARLDDVINTAGHRLSTYQMEEVLINNPNVIEAAVVPRKDDLKGEIPVGFVILKDGCKIDHKELQKQLVAMIREDIGPVACFKQCMVVDCLPKTRSGKCLRRTLKAMVAGEKNYKISPTILDDTVFPHIQKVIDANGLGANLKSNLVFDTNVKGDVSEQNKDALENQ